MYLWFVSVLVCAVTFKHVTFSNNDGLDKKMMNLTCYIDIKSERFWDILRTVLQNVLIINLNENKPMI